MATSALQYSEQTAALNEKALKDSVDFAQRSQVLTHQSGEDALFRLATNNAVAKIKGMAKTQEALNQLS
ncbi:hypothetical protein [Actimicrobium sp. CCI2.3]|uniref:hypothetical protein n=1 Tax=Actimicrobium sp. CCI2.3 TaxID=3048616 RepID=UPI002AB4FC4B|nr:hypothetical protein [Actimicrobium sp. CCI2.3]MDY7573738.1 hypothetical protein [Actimicrobium sp. CCI2.3]MEB0020990.1 hypothetical protein [Actimicrobium sp. CCI2.3]